MNDDTTKAQFFKEQLLKEPGDSKKWQMAKAGLIGIVLFFICGVALFLFRPTTSGSVVVLVQTAIGAWTGIVGIYLGAQGSVDFKTTQALSNSVETRTEKEDITIAERTVAAKHFDGDDIP